MDQIARIVLIPAPQLSLARRALGGILISDVDVLLLLLAGMVNLPWSVDRRINHTLESMVKYGLLRSKPVLFTPWRLSHAPMSCRNLNWQFAK